MKKTIYTISIILIAFQTTAIAKPLTLEQFITSVINKHPKLKSSYSAYLQDRLNAMKGDDLDDPILSASVMHQLGMSSPSFGTFNEEGRVTSLQGYLEKNYSKTGTHLKVSAVRSITKNIPGLPGLKFPDVYHNQLEVMITQPLLQNAKGYIQQFPSRLKPYQLAIAELTYFQDIDTFITVLTNSYLDWFLAENKVVILKKQIQKTEKQLQIVKKQVQSGTAEKLAYIMQRQNLKQKKITLLQEEGNLKNKKQTILNYLQTDQSHITSIKPKTFLLKSGNITAKQSIEQLKDSSFFAQLQDNVLAIQEETLALYANQSKSQTHLFATKLFESIENSSSNQIKNLGESQPLTVGISTTKPLGQLKNKRDIETQELEIAKSMTRFENQLSMLTNTVEQLWQDHGTLLKLEKETLEMLTLAIQREKLEQQKYKQGRSGSFSFVLDAQDAILAITLQIQELEVQRLKIENAIIEFMDIYPQYYKKQ